jgi:hypothetical protein
LPAAQDPALLHALESMPAPTEVDAAVWSQLKAALATQLRARDGKTTSAPPQTIRAAAVLSFDSTTTSLTWGYANPGDYDQNGLITISDLTPLGVHFGESNGGQPWPSRTIQSVIDGDNNGEINIADVTPIGANFGADVTGYNIYTSKDTTVDYPKTNSEASTGTPVDSVPFSAATGDKTHERVMFSAVLAAHAFDDYHWVRPAENSVEGTASTVAPGALLPRHSCS